ELPELVLLVLVERMIVALRAAHGDAEENLGGLGGRLQAILVHFVGQEVRRAVEVRITGLATAGRRDQLLGELVVLLVLLKRATQVLLHATTHGERVVVNTTRTANQRVGPQRGPV